MSQYVNSKNGFILDTCSAKGVADVLDNVVAMSAADIETRALSGYGCVANFTFEHYRQRIQKEILKN